ncbi:cystinosin homolog [Anopheles moucheti]|uniref:cystinosin homolog n=1 Tax=Anopheles moucheti TaxID=186751 RepID=UPI0022F048A9|nr:cystinosin homolog [Anopheles moucheti]
MRLSKSCILTLVSLFLRNISASEDHGNTNSSLKMSIEPQALTISLTQTAEFVLFIQDCSDAEHNLTITWDVEEYIEVSPSFIMRNGCNDSRFSVKVAATKQGQFIIQPVIISSSPFYDNGRLFVQLKVAKYRPLIIISMLIGWTYTVCWTIGDYFQAWTSYRRKSVVGLSIDFLFLNIVGNCCYATFNVVLFSSEFIEAEYFRRHPFGLNPVVVNDVGYAVHAVFGNLVLITQCYIYHSGGTGLSTVVKLLISGYVMMVSVFCILTVEQQMHWLDFLYILSYVKLSTNLIKYIPQVLMNYQRKSTEGFAISNRLLDITGGLLSLLQMVLNGWNYDDWQSIVGSPDEYYRRHPFGLNPVIGNDIGFAAHAVFGTGFTIFQCRIYETGGNSVSKPAKAIIATYLIIIIATMSCAMMDVLHWLDFLYILSYIKLSTTMIKYFPQAYMNYRRKSTEGFEIMNRLLDLAGGLFSILQMVLNAWNFDDWRSIGGDPVKFGLGIFSILFDLVFMFQHYILYRKRNIKTPVEFPMLPKGS